MYNRYAIFGFARSGTKLLAEVYRQQGFHNYGEYFDTFSSKIEDNRAIRRTRDQQYRIQRKIDLNTDVGKYLTYHSRMTRKRLRWFKEIDTKIERSILTLWPENIDSAPELLYALEDRYFLCIQRKNKFEQLLSRYVTQVHKNYNAEINSKPVKVQLPIFSVFYHRLSRTEKFQKWIVDNNRGMYVDFDELITENANLGFDYKITTSDQHSNLEDLILNLDEVKEKFENLSKYMK